MEQKLHSVEVLSGCPICNDSESVIMATPAIKIGEGVFGEGIKSFKLVKCRNCGLEFVNPRPSREILERFYGTPGYPAHEASNSALVSSFRVNFLGTLLPKSRLLDYGCGGGSFLKTAQDDGWITTGIEPSPVGRKNAQDLGVEVYGKIEDLPGQKRFDLVTMFHVLEHVPDLYSVLSLVKSVMTENGVLVVEVPNISSFRTMVYKFPGIRNIDDERYRAFPIHLYGFNRRTLARLLLRNGLCPVRETSFDVGWNVRAAELKKSAIAESGVMVVNGDSSSENGNFVGKILKQTFFSLCLGERLLVAARQMPVCGNVDT